jgi:hypothetical protein
VVLLSTQSNEIWWYDVHVTVQRDRFLKIKPTRCTNFFLEWNSTCFGQFLCPSSGVFHCTQSNGIRHTAQAVSKPVWHMPLLCVQWKTPDDGLRNCLKHVECDSKNKFEKLMHLVVFFFKKFGNTLLGEWFSTFGRSCQQPLTYQHCITSQNNRIFSIINCACVFVWKKIKGESQDKNMNNHPPPPQKKNIK